MTAVPKNLFIEVGATFTFGFNWYREAVPHTNPPTAGVPYVPVSALMHIRAKKDSPTPLLILRSEGLGPQITFAAAGRIDIALTPVLTNALQGTSSAVYDLEVTLAGEDVRRVLEGTVKISPGVTHE